MKFLSEEDIQAMHEATLRVLNEAGVFWTHKPSLDILTEAGCTVKDNRVFLCFLCGWSCLFLALRLINLPRQLGLLLTGSPL